MLSQNTTEIRTVDTIHGTLSIEIVELVDNAGLGNFCLKPYPVGTWQPYIIPDGYYRDPNIFAWYLLQHGFGLRVSTTRDIADVLSGRTSVSVCECGADKCKIPTHSTWCPKHAQEVNHEH